MTDILDELAWRGLLALSTDEEELRKAFRLGTVTFYCGFDPTVSAYRPYAPRQARQRPVSGRARTDGTIPL